MMLTQLTISGIAFMASITPAICWASRTMMRTKAQVSYPICSGETSQTGRVRMPISLSLRTRWWTSVLDEPISSARAEKAVRPSAIRASRMRMSVLSIWFSARDFMGGKNQFIRFIGFVRFNMTPYLPVWNKYNPYRLNIGANQTHHDRHGHPFRHHD